MSPRPIVFFDGVCPLCHAAVAALGRVDRHQRLRFAPLAGETAREKLTAAESAAFDSVVYWDGSPGGFRRRSTALIAALRAVGGPWRIVAGLLSIVPRPLRDAAYDVVAAHRRRWFGELDRCPPPPAALRDRFLP